MEFECDLSFRLFTVLDVVNLSQVCVEIFPMDKNIGQIICLKFCIVNGIFCAESLKMLQKAYGESTLLKTRVNESYTEKICRLKSHRLCVILVDKLESRINIMNLLIEEYDR